jgi:hypothetical protein
MLEVQLDMLAHPIYILEVQRSDSMKKDVTSLYSLGFGSLRVRVNSGLVRADQILVLAFNKVTHYAPSIHVLTDMLILQYTT